MCTSAFQAIKFILGAKLNVLTSNDVDDDDDDNDDEELLMINCKVKLNEVLQ